MKKIILLLIFILCIASCTKNNSTYTNITELSEIDGIYQLKVKNNVNTFNLNDLKKYINSNEQYEVLFNDSLVTDSLTLSVGSNIITIKGSSEYKINIYRLDTFSISFYDEDLLVSKKTYDEGNTVKISDIDFSEFNKYGFTCTGVLEEVGVDINSSVNLHLMYEPNSYNVTYSINAEINNVTAYYKQPLKITTPLIDGYTFSYWTNEENTIKFENGSIYDPLIGDKLIAVYEANKYNVVYVVDGIETKMECTYKDNLPQIKNPEKKGYTFIGWYTNDDIIYESKTLDVAKDLVLTAKFSPNKYNILLNNEGQISKLDVTYLSMFTLPTPTKNGYDFLGWYLNNELFNKNIYEFTSNITLFAKWKEIPVNVDITLNLETYGIPCKNIITQVKGESLILPTPVKEGFKFVGWFLDAYLTEPASSFTTETYKGEKLYAKFTLDNDQFLDFTAITRYNSSDADYDDIILYSSDFKIQASLYWQKIGIRLIDGVYKVSGIVPSGKSINELGVYDYCLMAYGACPNYSTFCNLNIKVGDEIVSFIDFKNLVNGEINNCIFFKNATNDSMFDNVKSYLKNKYETIHDVTTDLELVTSYEGYTINWVSSNATIISNSGVVTIPSLDSYVTLKAYIGTSLIYSFEVFVKGNGVITKKALATGYIYTPYTITQNAMNQLDIIYCAFIEFNDNAEWTNLSTMMNKINNEIFPKAKISNTKVVFSINKGTSSCFSTVSASPELREKLANKILDLIKEYGFDGVDVDWEVPLDSEKQNFTLLMKAIYEKVKAYNPNLLVTAAIGGGKWQPPKYDLVNSKDYMDYINLMTYSMTTANSYYQNALYPSSKGATLVSCSIDESVKIYNGYGITNNKILVGVPFYCTLQTNAGGPGSKVGTGKSIWYQTMLDSYPLSNTMKEFFDEECGVPYRYDATNKIFISYDNEQSIKVKCDYIHANGLAGIMYWQYGQDINDYLSNAIGKYI